MREFFRGWRRKGGVVTLVIALAFTAVWLGSRIVEDDLSYVSSDLRSRSGGIEKSDLTLVTSRYGGLKRNWAEREIAWRVPYGIVAVPLTLFSAYLILWKPRKRT
jgi:hypothetical protein